MTTSGQIPRFRESHCLRARYAKSTCRRCADACHRDAISLDGIPVIDTGACGGCAACTAACPSAALEMTGVDFWDIVRELDEAPAPVLRCAHVPEALGHSAVPCMGLLGAEHLAVLAVFLGEGVALNMVHCGSCADRAAAEAALAALRGLEDGLPSRFRGRVTVVRDATELDFEEVGLDRRQFLTRMGKVARTQVSAILKDASEDDAGDLPYWEKITPRRRAIAESILRELMVNGERGDLHAVCTALGHRVEVDDRCDQCFACVGACPNGALASHEEEIDDDIHSVLLFRSSVCSGCGLCERFCPTRSIQVHPGHDGRDAFAWFALSDSMADREQSAAEKG